MAKKRMRKKNTLPKKRVVKKKKCGGGKCPLKRVKKQIPMLQVLKGASPKMRKAIINNADKPLLGTLSECSLNVLNGNQKVSPKCMHLLGKYKNQLRHLAAPTNRVSYKRKRQILLQKGGFIIPTLVGSVLSGLLSKLL